jgi:hypothetical protein
VLVVVCWIEGEEKICDVSFGFGGDFDLNRREK